MSYGLRPPLVGPLQARVRKKEDYHSKGERKLAGLLEREWDWMEYEWPWRIWNNNRHKIWHPDFTIKTIDDYIVEYAGRPTVPRYAQFQIRDKADVYARNGIQTIFIYPEDIWETVYWENLVVDRISRGIQRDQANFRHKRKRTGNDALPFFSI